MTESGRGMGLPRVGVGTDVHPFGTGRVLNLAGLTWPGETVNVIWSSASVEPSGLRSPGPSMVASLMDEVVRRRRSRHGAGGRYPGDTGGLAF